MNAVSKRMLLVQGLLIAAIAAPATASAAPVSVGHSGWFWGAPQPQGNSLAATDFAGSRGYAVGDTGTVLRSDDGGATWAGLNPGTAYDLNRVQALGTGTVIIGGGCSVRRSDDGGGRFARLPFTASDARCPAKLAAFHFPVPSIGYILLDNGTVLRTPDAGRSFSQRTSLPGTAAAGGGSATPTDIRFSSADAGLAVSGGAVFRTTDGGNSWTAVPSAGSKVRTVRFLDASNVVAVGADGAFLTSTDGGATFTSKPLTGAGAGKNFTGVSCASTSTCLMTFGSTQVARTTDGGVTSTLVSAADSNLEAVSVTSAAGVVAVGDGGTTVASQDLGATFAPIGSRVAGTFTRIRSVQGPRAYAVGQNGRVARTLDGGRNWAAFGVSTPGDVVDVSFPVATTGFALDDDGTLLRTDNAGSSWRILDAGTAGAARAVIALDAKRVAVIGPRGVRRSKNGGASFGSSRSAAVRRSALTDAERVGSLLFAWGRKRLAVSSDGGSTWKSIKTPKGAIADADFSSRRRGFVLLDNGRLFVTANGGRRWVERTALGRFVEQVSFADAKHGFAYRPTEDSAPLRTDDGGRSWSPQVLTVNGLASVEASSAKGALLLTGVNKLFGTTTGGRLASTSRLSLKVSKRRLRRGGTVRVTGRLRPASAGSPVTIAVRAGTRYSTTTATVASTGAFTARVRIRRSSVLVAQWRGDDHLDGDGTAAVKVTVSGKARSRRR